MSEQKRSLKLRKPRPYRQQRRAEKRDEVHQMLARAAFELHDSVGPSQTTVSAIAERAGVQRLTVYRHFPSEESIFAACTAYAFTELAPPDPESWRDVDGPESRLRSAIAEMYEYYRRRARLLANLQRDAEMPIVAAALNRRRGLLARGAAILAEGWPPKNQLVSRLRLAAIGHALDFTTWRSLTEEQRLTQDEAVAMAVTFVKAAQ